MKCHFSLSEEIWRLGDQSLEWTVEELCPSSIACKSPFSCQLLVLWTRRVGWCSVIVLIPYLSLSLSLSLSLVQLTIAKYTPHFTEFVQQDSQVSDLHMPFKKKRVWWFGQGPGLNHLTTSVKSPPPFHCFVRTSSFIFFPPVFEMINGSSHFVFWFPWRVNGFFWFPWRVNGFFCVCPVFTVLE